MPASKVQYEKVCPVCGNRFKAKTLYSVYCSHNCSNKARKKKEKDEQLELERLKRIEEMPLCDYVSVSQAADLYGISKYTVYRLIRSGCVRAEKYGPHLTRVRKSDMERMNLIDLPNAVLTPQKVKEKEEHRIYSYRFDESDCYTIGEINQKFALHDTTIWSAIRKKGIPICYRGNYAYVPKDLIDQLFSNQH